MRIKQVQFISTKQAIDLRSRILRPNQPIENCHYIGDNDEDTFHLGVLVGAKILSSGTFIQERIVDSTNAFANTFACAKLVYRLRGMATDHNFQRQGLGKLIIESALIELQKRNCDLLWFNARVTAEDFYKKLGFKSLEKIFDISLTGPHKVMYKWLA